QSVGQIIARSTGRVDFGVTAGDFHAGGGTVAIDRAEDINFFATGDVTVNMGILNGGAGDIGVVAGWDGSTGLYETYHFNSCPVIEELYLDIGDILADDASWGNGGGVARIGDGSQTGAAGVGSAA